MLKVNFDSAGFIKGVSACIEAGSKKVQNPITTVDICNAKLMPQLEKDIVQFTNKTSVFDYELSNVLLQRLKFVPGGEELFAKQVEEFLRLRNKTVSHLSSFTLKKGDLLHGAHYSAESVQGILKDGIVTGDIKFAQKPFFVEDCETFGCADFFISPKDFSLDEYFSSFVLSKRPNSFFFTPEKNWLPKNFRSFDYKPKQRKLAYIIDTEKLASDSSFLFKNSATPGDFKGSPLEGIVARFPGYENHRAVLMGVPSNYISKIVVCDDITDSELQFIKKLRQQYGLDFKLHDICGNIL